MRSTTSRPLPLRWPGRSGKSKPPWTNRLSCESLIPAVPSQLSLQRRLVRPSRITPPLIAVSTGWRASPREERSFRSDWYEVDVASTRWIERFASQAVDHGTISAWQYSIVLSKSEDCPWSLHPRSRGHARKVQCRSLSTVRSSPVNYDPQLSCSRWGSVFDCN